MKAPVAGIDDPGGPASPTLATTTPHPSLGLGASATHWPEYVCEALELCLFMISAGFFTILLEYPASPVHHAIADPFLRRTLIGLAMGGTAIAIVFSPLGKRSGAHFNPAVTLTFWRLGKVKGWDALFYVVAQFIGAILGLMLVAWFLHEALAHRAINFVATLPGPRGPGIAFIAESLIAFILMTVVSASQQYAASGPLHGHFRGLPGRDFHHLRSALFRHEHEPGADFWFGSRRPLMDRRYGFTSPRRSSRCSWRRRSTFGANARFIARNFIITTTRAVSSIVVFPNWRSASCKPGSVLHGAAIRPSGINVPGDNVRTSRHPRQIDRDHSHFVSPLSGSAWSQFSSSRPVRFAAPELAVESIGMTVSDADRAVDFYSQLNFRKVSEVEVFGPEYEHLEGVFGARMRIVRMQLGSEFIDLTQYLAPPGRPIPPDSRSNDRWFQHLAIVVRDMDAAFAKVRALKAQFVSTGPQTLPATHSCRGRHQGLLLSRSRRTQPRADLFSGWKRRSALAAA